MATTNPGRLGWAPLSIGVGVGVALASIASIQACSSGDTTPSGSSSDGGATSSTHASSTSTSTSTRGAGGSPGAGGSSGAGGSGGAGGAEGVQWKAAGSMQSARIRHTATRLKDGRVLVTGGQGDVPLPFGTSEIYDPAHDAWSAGPMLVAPRENHTAVLLDDGRVLLVGGGESDNNGLPDGQHVLDSTEIYDPTTNAFTAGPTLLAPRGHHQATLLADGRVLVAGGTTTGGGSVLQAEVLSVDRTTWTAAGTLSEGRSLFGLAQRASGDVVVAGGLDGFNIRGSAERFDPTTSTWSALPSLGTPRFYVPLAPLAGGGVIASGGIGIGANAFLASNELLASDDSAWAAGPAFPPRAGDFVGGTGVTLLALSSGSVLAAGSYGYALGAYGAGSFSGIFDEATSTWVRLSSLDVPRALAPAIELPDHRVLLVGGTGGDNGAASSCSISADPVH